MAIQTPDWVKNAVLYQIFPDRFARTHRHVDDPAMAVPLEPWETPPSLEGYKGGRPVGGDGEAGLPGGPGSHRCLLYGQFFSRPAIIDITPTIITGLNPLLGGDQAFADLLEAAHQKGAKGSFRRRLQSL